jgi:hypothetical protein
VFVPSLSWQTLGVLTFEYRNGAEKTFGGG